ncbi:hypothetical protein DFJ73DRAFT_779287 [Zopfochytrium polystomum]|nr:hypothetical protein DFJ73DRAFT_779287 [Zopfochytrium polystomum]
MSPDNPLHGLTVVVVGCGDSFALAAVCALSLLHPRHAVARVHLWLPPHQSPQLPHFAKIPAEDDSLLSPALCDGNPTTPRLTIHRPALTDDPTDCGISSADVFLHCGSAASTDACFDAARKVSARLFVRATSDPFPHHPGDHDKDDDHGADDARSFARPAIHAAEPSTTASVDVSGQIETAVIRLPAVAPSMQYPSPGWWPTTDAARVTAAATAPGCAAAADQSGGGKRAPDAVPVDVCAVYATAVVCSLLRPRPASGVRRRDHGAFTLCAEATAMRIPPPPPTLPSPQMLPAVGDFGGRMVPADRQDGP